MVPLARAGQDARAESERLIRHGVQLRRAHDDEAAQREFQKAYELVRTPRAAAQLGLAEQALGRWEDAERHVSEAIAAPGDPWVAKNRAALDGALNTIQAHLGRVEVIGDPAGASVSVNGKASGHLPLPDAVRVSAGEVDIDVRAPGYTPMQRRVSIVGGQYQKVVIHLVKEKAAPEAVATPVAPAAVEPKAPPDAAPRPAPPAPEPSSSVRPIVKWTAAGLAGAALVTGTVFTILHSKDLSRFDEDCYVLNGDGVDQMGQKTAACHDQYVSYRNDSTFAIVGFAAAGAFAVTWLVLQLTEPSPAPPAEQAFRGPSCSPSASATGISCLFHF